MLKSLASYGFVVIGNDSQNNGSGQEIYEMRQYAEKLNAATKFECSRELFSSVFPTSMPNIGMCVDRFRYWAYDISLVEIPCF